MSAPDDIAATALAMARRFVDGARMWCIAPGRLDHARHVAVEFVHPIGVGCRALPVFALSPDDDPMSEISVVVRHGDMVMLIGRADDARLVELRLSPWWRTSDTLTICLTWGPEPDATCQVAAADHVIALGGDGYAVEVDLVRAYHVLWELVHVCLEHPDVLAVDVLSTDPVRLSA